MNSSEKLTLSSQSKQEDSSFVKAKPVVRNTPLNQFLQPEVKSLTKKQMSPQYLRVNMAVCMGLFDIYKQLKGAEVDGSFSDKLLETQTINYRKIIELLCDAGIVFDVSQKLVLLKHIKKISINQNFIKDKQFVNIYKTIIHSMGIKQGVFRTLYQSKIHEQYQSNKGRRKIKTQASYLSAPPKQLILKPLIVTKNKKNILQNPQSRGIKEDKQTVKKKRIDTEINNYKAQSSKKYRREMQYRKQKSYAQLSKQRSNCRQITWQSLFLMTSNDFCQYISIPNYLLRQN